MARVLFSVCFSIQYVNMFKISANAVKTDVILHVLFYLAIAINS